MVSPVVSPRGVVVLTPEESALLASEMEKDVGALKGKIAPSNTGETTALASTSSSILANSNPIFTAHSTSSLPTSTSSVQTSNSSSSIASSASASTIPNKTAPAGDSSTGTAIPDSTQVPPTPLITAPTLKEEPGKYETEVMIRTNVEHVAELKAVLEGKNKSFFLKKGQQYIIGRTSDCQIALEAKHMSKHHARLGKSSSHFFVSPFLSFSHLVSFSILNYRRCGRTRSLFSG
jgi:hypothetical protein